MKLIIYNLNIEFQINDEANHKECMNFLLKEGYDDISNFHFDIDKIICTANYYGKPKSNVKMCLDDLSSYASWIKIQGLDYQSLTSYNAEQLNILCRMNGYER